jgi:hypothetical protein
MAKVKTVLGYTAAGLTVAAALLTPFLLMGAFSSVVAHAGLHVDEKYAGGPVACAIDHANYKIEISQPVRPRLLERGESYVQVAFSPADKLPTTVDETLDLDGDGQPDVHLRFAAVGSEETALKGEVTALNTKYLSFTSPASEGISRIVARIGNRVVVRVPLAKGQ